MDKETKAHLAGSRGEALVGGTIGEQAAHERGLASRRGAGGLPIFLLPVAAILFACFWPVAGFGGFLSAAIGLSLLGWVYPGHDGMAALLVVLVAGGVGIYYTFKVERRLERSRPYRALRHGVRLILLAILSVYCALMWGHGTLNPLYVPNEITLRWIDSQLSAKGYVGIFIVLVLAHVFSKRLDERVSSAVQAGRILGAAPDAKDRKVAEVASGLLWQKGEERRERWARRWKWGLIFGLVAAIVLALIGAPAGSVVFGFFFLGLIGALLSRFLTRKRQAEPKARWSA